jgi:hypothetical protein
MYLERIRIQNVGPLASISLDARFTDQGNPLPLVIVGKNGAGKSLFMATIVNALVDAHATVFEDADVSSGKVFKLRAPQYIKHGESFYASEVSFTDGLVLRELQLAAPKSNFVEAPTDILWAQTSGGDSQNYNNNFRDMHERLTRNMEAQCHLYFPPNRFEDPAWLNVENLTTNASYASLKNFTGYSNRPVVTFAPLRGIHNWLLDLIYDSFATERAVIETFSGSRIQQVGAATDILAVVLDFFRKLLKLPSATPLHWVVGQRSRRRIGLTSEGRVLVNNIFGLSTGEVVLMGIFLSIIRDFDLSSSELRNLSDIKGVVVIDEIDMHLHTELQFDLLPKLLAMFPRVQFIVTTHSPLFVLGMSKAFDSDNFQLHELPSGLPIDIERFSEFEVAFDKMRETAAFDAHVRSQVERSTAPSVYVEGTTDIDYITAAAEALGQSVTLAGIALFDGGGSGNLDKIWDARKALSTSLNHSIVLVYDCDTARQAGSHERITRHVLGKLDRRVDCGIENLFPDSLMRQAMQHSRAFLDVTPETTRTVRGVAVHSPESWRVNKDEKRNLCDWVIANAAPEDFEGFRLLLDMLSGLVPQQLRTQTN